MSVTRHKRGQDTTEAILESVRRNMVQVVRDADDAVADSATKDQQPKPPMKVSSKALAQARRNTKAPTEAATSIFKPFEPAPGVIPKGTKAIAMDEMTVGDASFGAVNNWAWGGGVQFAEGTTFLGYPYLAELAQRAEYRNAVEKIATEMTRKWIKLEVTSDVDGELDDASKKARAVEKGKKIKEIWKRMDELKVRNAFRTAARHDGYFGRGHLFLVVGDEGTDDLQELATPLVAKRSKVNKNNPLRAIRNVEPWVAYPQQYNSTNPLRSDWYKPTVWYVMAQPVHATRFLTMVAREVPDLLKPAYAFGGLALSQMGKPYVDNWLRTRQAVCDLIESFSVSGIYTNMSSVLQAGLGEGDGSVLDRLELFNLIRTNSGSMALDKDTEEFFNISTPLGTLDALQAQAQEQMAAVWNIPVAILLGLQPKGLNASSEAEVRIFYDFIHSQQENVFRDPLTMVIQLIQLSLYNEIDPEITFKFEPLWALSEKERAEVKKIEAETGDILIGNGTIHPIEERRRIADDPDMGYNSIDVEDVPEEPEDPMAAMMGGEGDEDEPGDNETERDDAAAARQIAGRFRSV